MVDSGGKEKENGEENLSKSRFTKSGLICDDLIALVNISCQQIFATL